MSGTYATAKPPAYDLSNCADEPIRFLGQIQPHGHLLALDDKNAIVAISRGLLGLLGLDPNAVTAALSLTQLPKSLQTRINACQKQLAEEDDDFPAYGGHFRPDNSASEYEVVATLNAQGLCLVELLPLTQTDAVSGGTECWFQHEIQRLMTRLGKANTLDDFSATIVRQFRELSGYDRVMVYRFDEDYNGEVIAEAARDDLESFLGLHYPASDIPPQARELYLTNVVRLLGNVESDSVDILLHKDSLPTLDLSHARLRAVSPLHIAYLRNMGVGATLTISIIVEQKLWGLIACHHYSPKVLSYTFLQSTTFLSRVLSGELNRIIQNENELAYEKIIDTQNQLIRSMNSTRRFMDALVGGKPNITHLLNADSAMVFFSSDVFFVGECPDTRQATEFLQWVKRQIKPSETLYTHTNLESVYPPAASFKSIGSGVIVLFLSYNRTDAIIWFRKEILRTVSWAGNPQKAVVRDESGGISRLQPRQSFEEWKEIKSGTCIPWTTAELNTAANFRNPIVEMTLKQGVLLEKLNQELMQAKNEAILANERKTDAISNMSHEVRTPLNSIIGYTELLKYGKAGPLTEDQQRYINYAADNARHLLSIINDILDIAKIEAGNFTLHKKAVVPQIVLEESIQLTAPLLAQKNVTLTTDYAVAVSEPIQVDPKRLKQVLVNLISNAIKYNRTGGKVKIRYRIAEHQGHPHAVFEVSDTGIGMTEEQTQKLYSRFFRVENGASRKVDGTGLGLSITKQLIELHGGFIQVSSRPDEGSQFSAHFPVA